MPPVLDETAAMLRAADCYIVCTPEMNHTIAPGLTNMMNYFGSKIYAKKPSGIATYSAGMWGGRPMCGLVACVPRRARMHTRLRAFPAGWDLEKVSFRCIRSTGS